MDGQHDRRSANRSTRRMSFDRCEFEGCDKRAVFHIYEDGRERNFCELHAVFAGGATPETADADGESREFSLSSCQCDGIGQVDLCVPSSTLLRIPEETAKRYCVIPVAEHEGTLVLASREALAHEDRELLRFVANSEIRLFAATEDSIRRAIATAYRVADE